ncbi:hypothetical protein JCM10908_006342 [Rhodotorula pacifica]|uniref:Dabb family protein n=1 Tax=Rhodotorula pacifica TaxID=1495444 RepID=UPI00316B3090
MSTITHIVSLRYKPSTTSAEKHLVGSSFLALQDQCQHPQRGGPYLTVTGGRNNSPEGFAKGFEHAWILTFANEEDRAYYLEHDPAHLKFKELAGQHAEDIFVFDFQQGVF